MRFKSLSQHVHSESVSPCVILWEIEVLTLLKIIIPFALTPDLDPVLYGTGMEYR